MKSSCGRDQLSSGESGKGENLDLSVFSNLDLPFHCFSLKCFQTADTTSVSREPRLSLVCRRRQCQHNPTKRKTSDSTITSSTSSYSRFGIQESFGEHLQQQHGGLAAEVASALCSPGGTQVVVEAVVALIHGGLQGWGLSGSDQPP